MIGRLLSFWEGLFSGAMLNFQGVFLMYIVPPSFPKATPPGNKALLMELLSIIVP